MGFNSGLKGLIYLPFVTFKKNATATIMVTAISA
jgi:hypothetical protein